MSQVKTFGRYNLIRKVAQGGMAEIFLAKFQGIGGFEKKIIIKRILPRFSENQEFIKMLIHEAKTAVQLHHQNIVQIYDLGKVRDTYYISMEYIRGKDLRTVLNRLKSQGQLMPRELAIFITREICKGLDYAHNITDQHGQALNLVHRDISPPNVLLSLEGEVKIIDFGIAKATSQATDTQAGVFKGKFAYMAPEQASGVPIDPRADIFATGLILWEMLSCKKLLEAESDIQTLERAKRIDSYNIPFSDYGVPEQLEHIIRKALKQDRATRYQTAGEMARDLTIYLNLNYPGFSETDLADFLRTLFNLDKRRGTASGDMITHGQGERSLTGSDFFRALAQGGQETTDPSAKIVQEASATRSAPSGAAAGAGAAAGSGAVAAAAVAAMPREPRRRADARSSSESGEFWSLENDIRDEIEVFAQSGAPEVAKTGNGQVGWVSQLAEDFVRAEDGTLHPLISDALRATAEAETASRVGPEDPTILLQDGKVVSAEKAAREAARGAGKTSLTAATSTTAGMNIEPGPVGGTTTSTRERRGVGVWAVGGMALLLTGLTLANLLFPAQAQRLKESLGLVRTAQIALKYTPPDATVLVNELEQPGLVSPASLSLPVGQRHTIKLHKEGYEEKQLPIDLVASAGPMQFDVSLDPLLPKGNGRIDLQGLLPGAVVYLNGRPVVPEQLDQLPVDTPLKLKVLKEHYLPFETDVTLGREPVPIQVTLQPEPVRLSVNAGVPNATVYVDGRPVGPSPYSGDGYQPGRVYKVEIRASGYQPYATVLTPTVGSSPDLRVSLAPLSSGEQSRSVVTNAPSRNPTKTPTPTPAAAVNPTPAPRVDNPPVNANPPPVQNTPEPVAQPEPKRAGMVQVQILVNPWAEVYIDGKYVGRTPVRNLSVKTGRHTLRLVNPEKQVDYVVEKEIAPPAYGEVQTFNYELE